MGTITLKNYDKDRLDEIRGKKPDNFGDLFYRREIAESFQDKGISRFKEIKDMNHISFGHFILLEKILALEIELDDKIKMIAPVILRPLDEVKLDNDNKEKEDKHKELVFDESIGSVYGAFNRFLELRQQYLHKTYNGVIYDTVHDDEEKEEEEEKTDVGTTQSAREFHAKKFFWNSMISLVAGGDIFKFNDTLELMMYQVMPYLAEKRSLEIIETLEYKQRNI